MRGLQAILEFCLSGLSRATLIVLGALLVQLPAGPLKT